MSTSARILIVEDEPNVRLVFRTALESTSYTLSAAEDGQSALRWLKQSPFDLVLLDLQMPGLSGMEVLRQLRDSGNAVPVVIITAHGSIPDAVAAMRLGAVDFLAKPVTPEALRKVVADALAREGFVPTHPARPHHPDPAAEALAEAKREFNRREFDKAEQLLRRALDRDSRSAEAYYLTGVLHEMRDERDAAYRSYRAAVQSDPQYEPARLHLLKYYKDRML